MAIYIAKSRASVLELEFEVAVQSAEGGAHLGQVALIHGLAQVVIGDEAAIGVAEGLKVALGAGPELLYVEDYAEHCAYEEADDKVERCKVNDQKAETDADDKPDYYRDGVEPVRALRGKELAIHGLAEL